LRLIRKYGFDMLQVYDDLIFKPAWPVLFALAPLVRETKTLLGPGVVNPYNCHPSLIASNLSCLHEESGGRAFAMVGRGAFLDLVGIKQVRPITTVREAIEVIHKIISCDTGEYEGEVFKIREGAYLQWRPTTHSIPPIWIGTWGPRTARLAGKMTQVDGIMISSITDPRYVRLLKQSVENGAKSVGRDAAEIQIGIVPGTLVSRDGETALNLARQASAFYLPYLRPMTDYIGVSEAEIRGIKEALAVGDRNAAASLVSDKAVNGFKLWGTPNDIIEKTWKLIEEGGVTRVNFGFGRGPEDLEGIELLGKYVLPYFRN